MLQIDRMDKIMHNLWSLLLPSLHSFKIHHSNISLLLESTDPSVLLFFGLLASTPRSLLVPGARELPGADPGLRLACPVEEQVRDADDDVIDDLSARNDVREPCEHFCATTGDVEEGQEWEEDHNAKAVNRYTGLSTFAKKFRRLAFNRQTV